LEQRFAPFPDNQGSSSTFSPFPPHFLPPPGPDVAQQLSYCPSPPLLILLLFEIVLHVLFRGGWWFAYYILTPPFVLLGVVSDLVVDFGRMIILLASVVPVLHVWWSLSGCIYCSSFVPDKCNICMGILDDLGSIIGINLH